MCAKFGRAKFQPSSVMEIFPN